MKGPKGIWVRRCTLCRASNMAAGTPATMKLTRKPDERLAVADPADESATQSGKPDVAESNAFRHGEEQREEGSKGDRAADDGCQEGGPAVGPRRGENEERHPQSGCGVHDRRGYPQVLDVDGGYRYQARRQEAVGGQLPYRAEPPGEQDEKDSRTELQQGIPGRDVRSATPAAAPQDQIRDNGDVVVWRDGRTASIAA